MTPSLFTVWSVSLNHPFRLSGPCDLSGTQGPPSTILHTYVPTLSISQVRPTVLRITRKNEIVPTIEPSVLDPVGSGISGQSSIDTILLLGENIFSPKNFYQTRGRYKWKKTNFHGWRTHRDLLDSFLETYHETSLEIPLRPEPPVVPHHHHRF